MGQSQTSGQYEHLKDLWTKKHREVQYQLLSNHERAVMWLSHHVKNATLGSLTLAMTMQSPVMAAASESVKMFPTPVHDTDYAESDDLSSNVFLLNDLHLRVPEEVRPLTTEEEIQITDVLTQRFGFSVLAELDGKRLNRSYGYIGAEQHLMRYPGDTIATHFTTGDESIKFARSGMAPGRGAWGYFTHSGASLSDVDINREKYYIAVQTFLAPGFSENVSEYYSFFKYRKMLVVNPENGRAMVVVIGDAGPAQWTGKSLGGSPEVMDYLKRVDGGAKGPVLYFFIDDPNNTIPLGPVKPA